MFPTAKRHSTLWPALLIGFLLAVSGRSVLAQVDAGSIQGQVSDSTGAFIPNAAVTITNEATGQTEKARSDSGGNYTFSPVRIGLYTVVTATPGFTVAKREHVRVDIQQQVSLPFVLSIVGAVQTVEVTTSVPLLQSQSASVGQVVEAQQINDLPLNGRNYVFLAQLAAGVTFAQTDKRGENNAGRFSANGLKATENDFLLDGIDNNSQIISRQNGKDYVIQPTVDALSEFKIQTNDYNAEFGRAAGAVINATVKSGTNRYHGDVWEFFRNDVLDANDYFLNHAGQKRPGFRRNQFGGALGGPFILPHLYNGRKRTFVFGDYEGTRQAQGNTLTGTVPTLLERNSGYTNFSDLISLQSGNDPADASGKIYPLGTIFDPATTTKLGIGYVRTPFTKNMISSSRIDPNAVALLNLLPLPTLPTLLNNYITSPTFVDNYNNFDVRVDQILSDKDYLFVRYSYNGHNQMHPGIYSAYQNGYADGGNSSFYSNFYDRAQNVAIGYTHTFSPRLVNDFRLGVNREHVFWLQPNGNTPSIPQQFGIQGVPQFSGNGGLPQFNVGALTQFGSNNSLPSVKSGTIPQVNDDFTLTRGAHTIKLGYEQQRILLVQNQPTQSRGSFAFTGSFTSVYGQVDSTTGVAQMLLLPTPASNLAGATTVVLSNDVDHGLRRDYAAGYAQDDWRATSKFTVNMGVRYDFYNFPTERFGGQTNFVPGPGRVGGTYYVTPQVNPSIPSSFVAALASEGVSVQQVNRVATLKKVNVAPRLGFSMQVTPRAVIRGGYGIFYEGYEETGGNEYLVKGYPVEFSVTRTATNGATPITSDNSIGLLENSFTNISLVPATVAATGIPLIGFYSPAPATSSQGYNLSVQYQLNPNLSLTTAFVGSLGRHIQTFLDPNSVGTLLPPTVTTKTYLPYQFTAQTGGQVQIDGASSSYNSGQVTLEQRASHGLTFLANFAYQKTLTDARDNLEGDIGAYRAPYLIGIGADTARADFDVRRIFHWSGTYELPYGSGRRFGSHAGNLARGALGGWSLNYIATVQDGQPFTVPCASTIAAGAGCYARLVNGQSPYANSGVSHFINAAAFATPAPVTTVGQSDTSPLGGGPTQVSGPPFRRLDASLFKQFHFSEAAYAEFRWEVFNITNTANFANPTALTYTNQTTFGQITATRDSPNDPREMQFSLKVYF